MVDFSDLEKEMVLDYLESYVLNGKGSVFRKELMKVVSRFYSFVNKEVDDRFCDGVIRTAVRERRIDFIYGEYLPVDRR